MDVTERITWTFPSGAERHGIVRNIVVRMGYQDEADRYRYYDLTDVAVTSPSGAPDSFTVSDFGAADRIRIGSADEYTSGTQVYDVSYTLRNVANPIAADQTVELNYNVFGTNETTPRDTVSVTVNAPAAASKVLCFQGANRSTTPCQGSGGDPATFSATSLQSGDAMTVVASYPAAAFDPGLAADVRGSDGVSALGASVEPAVNAAAWVGGIGAPVLALAAMSALVWTRGRDERYADLTPGVSPAPGTAEGQATTRGGKPVVAVQFHPPKGVQPGMVGVIIDETANPIDVSATLIDLAVRGFLRIEETDPAGAFSRTDWTLTRLDEPARERLLPYERSLLEGVFSSGETVVTLSGLKNHFASTLKSVQSQMYGEVVTRNWFRSSPQSQRAMWQGLGIFLAVVGAVLLFFAHSLVAAVIGGAFSGGIALGVGLVRRRRHHLAARLPDGGQDGRGLRRPRPVARLQGVPHDRRGRPDRLRGGEQHLQPLPAVCRRLRGRGPVGQDLRRRREGGRGRQPAARHADLVPLERGRLPRLHRHRQRCRQLLDDLDRDVHLDAGLLRRVGLLGRAAASPAAVAAAPPPAPGSRAVAAAPGSAHDDEQVPTLDLLVRPDRDPRHRATDRRGDVGLHLHRLDRRDDPAGLHLVTLGDGQRSRRRRRGPRPDRGPRPRPSRPTSPPP